MSKEAQDFYRSKKVENAKTEKMKRFLSLVNYEEEGKIMQEYVDQQLRLLSVGKSVKEKRIPTFKEYLEMHFVKTEESRYKCIYTKIVYSRDSAFKTYNQAFDIKP